MSADDEAETETPVGKRKMLMEDAELYPVNKFIPHNSLPTQGMVTPIEEDDMAQSYYEIFDTQRYFTLDSPVSVTSPGTETDTSVDSEHTETGVAGVHDDSVMYYNEGDGRLVSCSPPTAPPMSTYLTTKLVTDSLMWKQTFRSDSPSPDDPPLPNNVHNESESATRPDLTSSLSSPRDMVVDPMVLNDIEKEARLLATDVDNLVENLSCVLQSVSGLTVETVQVYRDGVCKTCDLVDSNIRGMYQVSCLPSLSCYLHYLPS